MAAKKLKQNIVLRDAHVTISKKEIDRAMELIQAGITDKNQPKFLAVKKGLEKRTEDLEKTSNEIISNLDPEEPESIVKEMELTSFIQEHINETIIKLSQSVQKYNKVEQHSVTVAASTTTTAKTGLKTTDHFETIHRG